MLINLLSLPPHFYFKLRPPRALPPAALLPLPPRLPVQSVSETADVSKSELTRVPSNPSAELERSMSGSVSETEVKPPQRPTMRPQLSAAAVDIRSASLRYKSFMKPELLSKLQ